MSVTYSNTLLSVDTLDTDIGPHILQHDPIYSQYGPGLTLRHFSAPVITNYPAYCLLTSALSWALE